MRGRERGRDEGKGMKEDNQETRVYSWNTYPVCLFITARSIRHASI